MSIATRSAQTGAPILDVLADRWSPRAYSSEPVSAAKMASALEAARWSPSANNVQPWRFIVGTKGTATFDTIAEQLVGFNQGWAAKAGALIVAVAETVDAEGNDRPWATYDLGQAVAHLSIQAHSDGLFAHQMAGFSVDGVRAAFNLPAGLVPVTVTALGELGDAETLPDMLREREVAPRTRLPLADLLIVSE
ncbi:MAG TPA: nitroreductase family protein [Plantibacter sp.]|uniref:nitroreductase family protein n=1 Tax=unclassified Plantibacter TaxID=2624265 RepID=UPI002C2BF9F3|nr:nitroreductase family protein [Plantibacter sp.]